MTLARAWGGQAFRASAATLVAPAAILIALAVSAGGGGLGGLGSLGQLFTGPPPPTEVVTNAGAESDLTSGETVVLAPAPAAAPATGAAIRGTTGGGGVVRAPGPSPGPIAEIGPPPGGVTPVAPRQPLPPVRRPPPRRPGMVERIGDSAKGVTNELPGPIGPTVGSLIDQVVGACRQVSCP